MIPTYQIHNVLRAFTQNLAHNGPRWLPDSKDILWYSEGNAATAEGKRQAVLEKITASIVDEIAGMGSQDQNAAKALLSVGKDAVPRPGLPAGEGIRFVYNAIDTNGEKITRECFI